MVQGLYAKVEGSCLFATGHAVQYSSAWSLFNSIFFSVHAKELFSFAVIRYRCPGSTCSEFLYPKERGVFGVWIRWGPSPQVWRSESHSCGLNALNGSLWLDLLYTTQFLFSFTQMAQISWHFKLCAADMTCSQSNTGPDMSTAISRLMAKQQSSGKFNCLTLYAWHHNNLLLSRYFPEVFSAQ